MPKKAIRPIRIEGDVAYVPLTQGYEAVIDAADVSFVDGRNWHALPRKRTVYAQASAYRPDGSRVALLMHAVISGFAITDHRDCNGLNNRRGNLRAATVSQNQQNCGVRSDNTSGVKGVDWFKRAKKWRARIRVNNKEHSLGYFDTKESAAAAYAKASAELHGEFGRLE